jgi:DNA-damage-inducible protein D
MNQDIEELPEYSNTMERLETVKKVSSRGSEYWLAREINELMGYLRWDNFEPVIERARASLVTNKLDPSHHILETQRMVEVGSGGKRNITDYFLSRPACYMIAMNGDPTKPEIAAAQAYFAIQTRRQELADEKTDEEKRLEVREKVTKSFKRVSGVAQNAGVRNNMQPVFHDARHQGLYGMSARDLKSRKGIKDNENLFDRAGFLELSAHDFQMNLAADALKNEGIASETKAIQKNREIAAQVRKTMEDAGATMPENLALEPPIKEIAKKIQASRNAITKA